jgi:PDDEXK-like domain of unknown function (DUF3799)
MNPNRPPSPDSLAKQNGHALHALVLEGEAFGRAFTEVPLPAAYPGALVALDDLKTKCRDLCEAVSGTKAELAKRIKAKDANVIIWDDVFSIFKAVAERDDLEVLKPDAMQEVRQAAATITVNPHLAKAFTGGVPEVSVFWVEDGIPLKARLDYLKPRTLVDLKRCANQRERPVDLAIRPTIADYRLDACKAPPRLSSLPSSRATAAVRPPGRDAASDQRKAWHALIAEIDAASEVSCDLTGDDPRIEVAEAVNNAALDRVAEFQKNALGEAAARRQRLASSPKFVFTSSGQGAIW